MSLYLISEILGLFVDTLTGDDMYSWGYRENFAQLIQMQLSKKPKGFPKLPLPIWNLPKLLNILEKS